MTIRKLYIALFVLLALIGASRHEAKALSEITASLEQIRAIDLCGSQTDREIIVTLSIGRIYFADSLFGFNFGIEYNPKKLYFGSALYSNTLAMLFEQQDMFFGLDTGMIYGYAGNEKFNKPPVSGELPLVAFKGKFLGDCPDTSLLKIKFIEFTDEFKKTVKEYKDLSVKAEIADKPERKLSIGSDTTLDMKKDSSISSLINIKMQNNARVDTIEISAKFSKSGIYKFNGYNEIHQDAVVLEQVSFKDSIYLKVYLKKPVTNEKILAINILKLKNVSDTSEINYSIKSINRCSCILRTENWKSTIKSEKKADSAVSEVNEDLKKKIKVYYDSYNDCFKAENIEDTIEKIEIYNMLGMKIFEMNIENNDFKINVNQLVPGVYPARLVTKNNGIYNLVLIKSNN